MEHELPRRTVTAIQYEFIQEVRNLFAEPFAYNPENMVINRNPDDWFLPYSPDDQGEGSMIDEILSASCYQDYVKNVWAKRPDKENCFICPLLGYSDGTNIDSRDRFSLEPFLFTFALFRRHLRNQPEAWGHLGLIPDIYLHSKASKGVASSSKKRTGETARNFHKILKVLLKPVLDLQETGIPDFAFRIGNQMKRVTLLIPLFLMTADGLEACKMTGRKIFYTDVVRICSGCDCSYDDADNANVKCKFLETEPIQLLSATALNHRDAGQRQQAKTDLHEIYYQNAVDNAFFPFKYLGGGGPHGIFGAIPPYFSHTVQEGVFKYVIKAVYKLVTTRVLSKIDFLASQLLCDCPRQTHRSKFPRCTFTHGISRTTKLTCTEMTGLLLSLSLLMGTDRCRDLIDIPLRSKQAKQKKKFEAKLTPEQVARLDHDRTTLLVDGGGCQDLSKLFTCLLGFQAWTKKKHFWTADRSTPQKRDEAKAARRRAQGSIKVMIKRLKVALPRIKGNKWKLQKVHNLLHFVPFIEKFGSVRNFDTACSEKNHKVKSKLPAATAQKVHDVFLEQTAKRVTDHVSISRACRRVGINPDKRYREKGSFVEEYDEEEENDLAAMFNLNLGGNPLPFSEVEKINVLVGLKYKLVKKRNSALRKDRWWCGKCDWTYATSQYDMWGPLRKFIIRKLTAYPVIHGFTEVCRKGITFRSHPNYRHRGPWIDWCLINYGPPAGDVPAKIVGFVLLVTMVGGIPSEDMAEWEGAVPPEDAELVEVRAGSKGADGKRVETTLRGEVHAIIHTCDFPRMNSSSDTSLTTRWDLEYCLENEPILRLVPLSSIVSPIFVVEEFPGLRDSKPPSSGIYHVQDMHTWASTFTAPDQPP